MSDFDDLAARARHVLDTNRYMTLGTTGPDGRPRLSPVYFTHADYREFYWVSSPQAQHSRNIAADPAIAIVIFDSSAQIGQGQAVYMNADASVIADSDLPSECAKAFARLDSDAVGFGPADLSGEARLRLYRATATSHEVHVPGRDPQFGKGIDTRAVVKLR